MKEKNTVNLEQEKSSNSPKDKIMQKITKEDLLNSGAHFGHVSSKTDPNFNSRLKLDKKIPDFAPGDTLRIGYKVSEGTRSRVQNYEGVVISRKGGIGISASFTVRKVSFGEGVERIFPLHSPNIDKITVVRRGKVRRAKLYYLRERSGRSARITEKTNYKP